MANAKTTRTENTVVLSDNFRVFLDSDRNPKELSNRRVNLSAIYSDPKSWDIIRSLSDLDEFLFLKKKQGLLPWMISVGSFYEDDGRHSSEAANIIANYYNEEDFPVVINHENDTDVDLAFTRVTEKFAPHSL